MCIRDSLSPCELHLDQNPSNTLPAVTDPKILDVETGSLLAKLWDARSRPLYPLPNVGFNATDDLVVTDGALWDPRRGVSSFFSCSLFC